MPTARPHMVTGTTKRPTNLSLRADLLDRAEALGVDVSSACERGLELQISDIEAQRWLEESRAAIQSSNAYVEAHGLPLSKHRPY